MNGLGKNLVLYFFSKKTQKNVKVFFIIVEIQQEKRPGCLLFFQIATTTTHLVFGTWFLVTG